MTEMFSGKIERTLNAISFRFEIKQRGELRLTTRATMVHHERFGNHPRHIHAKIVLDHGKAQIDAGGHAF